MSRWTWKRRKKGTQRNRWPPNRSPVNCKPRGLARGVLGEERLCIPVLPHHRAPTPLRRSIELRVRSGAFVSRPRRTWDQFNITTMVSLRVHRAMLCIAPLLRLLRRGLHHHEGGTCFRLPRHGGVVHSHRSDSRTAWGEKSGMCWLSYPGEWHACLGEASK